MLLKLTRITVIVLQLLMREYTRGRIDQFDLLSHSCIKIRFLKGIVRQLDPSRLKLSVEAIIKRFDEISETVSAAI